jgi:nucleoside transporter
MIVYMPTLALANSVAFRQMTDPSSEFATVRVCGTIGWIAAGLSISLLFAWDSPAGLSTGSLRNTFLMSGIASLVLGLFSFTLPRTAPLGGSAEQAGWKEILGIKALTLLRDRNFLAFFLSSILICVPLAFYYQNANQFLIEIHVANATGKQTIGQMSEVLFMLLLPIFLKRFGMKATLLVGMAAWFVRYALFAYGDAYSGGSMLLVGIALHGVCYDFFFVSGQIYTDSKAGAQYKSAAQGLITLATYGVGMLIGFWAAGVISDLYVTGGLHDWRSIWLWPAAFAAVVFSFFLFTFRNEPIRYEPT